MEKTTKVRGVQRTEQRNILIIVAFTEHYEIGLRPVL